MTKWLFYRVPDHRRIHYVLCILMISVIIPEFIMGVTFTNLGHFLNFLFFDILYYIFLKIETADDN